jgi:hypothetical protein
MGVSLTDVTAATVAIGIPPPPRLEATAAVGSHRRGWKPPPRLEATAAVGSLDRKPRSEVPRWGVTEQEARGRPRCPLLQRIILKCVVFMFDVGVLSTRFHYLAAAAANSRRVCHVRQWNGAPTLL